MGAYDLTPTQSAEGLEHLERAKALYAEFLTAWDEAVTPLEMVGSRAATQVEAYQPFARDQGLGLRPNQWFTLVEEALQDVPEHDDQCGASCMPDDPDYRGTCPCGCHGR